MARSAEGEGDRVGTPSTHRLPNKRTGVDQAAPPGLRFRSEKPPKEQRV
jgi:hypothetical protein